MPVAALSLSLVGPAIIAAAQTAVEQVTKHLSSTPQTDNKGSVNLGGGGGGSGSGCGKKAACGGCKKKSKGCGGGGGGCGGSKKSNPEAVKFKVVFKDVDGGKIKEEQVEKDSSATEPFVDNDTCSAAGYAVKDCVFERWDTYDYKNVQSDMEVNAVYRNITTDSECSGSAVQILDGILTSAAQETIQQFSDECNQIYNDCVDDCIETIDKTVDYIGNPEASYSRDDTDQIISIMDQVEPHAKPYDLENSECTNWSMFNDTKKCILNIQSCYIFQTRMLFNSTVDDARNTMLNGVNELTQMARNGEDFTDRMKEIKSEFDDLIEEIELDNKEAFDEFLTNLNLYIDDINKCFPTEVVTKFEQ